MSSDTPHQQYRAGCQVCGANSPAGFALCFCCAALVRQLQVPLVPVVAVADYRLGDRLHRLLRGYKDAPVAEARRRYTDQLVAMTASWLAANRGRLQGLFGPAWETVATVPSSCRPHGAPVDAVVHRLPDFEGRHRPLLVRGPEPTGHLSASRRGFALPAGADPARHRGSPVLLVEDTVITGARAQSAAVALRLHGIPVVGVLALGRVVGPAGVPRGSTGR